MNGDINDFDGIAFDIEIGDSGLEQDFELCFAALKQMGKKVIVSVSFSSPYSIDDSESLMESILLSENIDLLSPQLYQNGNVWTVEFKLSLISITSQIFDFLD